jgi:hypothetical protein
LVPWVALSTSAEVFSFVVLWISGAGVILAVSTVVIIGFVLPLSIAVDLVFSPAVRT